MARIAPLSGFPEHLPAAYLVEQAILDTLRETFELHGFSGIETRAVEPVSQLLSKGETSKEIYLLNRLQDTVQQDAVQQNTAQQDKTRSDDADANTSGNGAGLNSVASSNNVAGSGGAGVPRRDKNQLGLHFDLTVPFARYVIENAGKLQFPFKRYQIQKVWRGERPQDGRYREFIQADIDVVGQNVLPAHYEAELPLVMADAFARLREFGVPTVKILVNNRKVLQGFYQGLGLTDIESALRCIDKLDKIGADAVKGLLVTEAGATESQANACVKLAQISGSGAETLTRARELAVRYAADTELFDEGISELSTLISAAEAQGAGTIEIDLKIARGLDYYTGAVYESVLIGHEDLGSICSGGRYDSLATDGKTTYPGVGLSIGVSRLVSRLLSAGLVSASRAVPTAVLVVVNSEEKRAASDAVAAALRARGIATEVAPSAAKFGKQIQFAERRGIPFVWFLPDDAAAADHQVKDIRTGQQVAASPAIWQPPTQDLRPTIKSSFCASETQPNPTKSVTDLSGTARIQNLESVDATRANISGTRQ